LATQKIVEVQWARFDCHADFAAAGLARIRQLTQNNIIKPARLRQSHRFHSHSSFFVSDVMTASSQADLIVLSKADDTDSRKAQKPVFSTCF